MRFNRRNDFSREGFSLIKLRRSHGTRLPKELWVNPAESLPLNGNGKKRDERWKILKSEIRRWNLSSSVRYTTNETTAWKGAKKSSGINPARHFPRLIFLLFHTIGEWGCQSTSHVSPSASPTRVRRRNANKRRTGLAQNPMAERWLTDVALNMVKVKPLSFSLSLAHSVVTLQSWPGTPEGLS